MMARRHIKVPRPPPSPRRAEFPAVIEPRLRDIPEYVGVPVEGRAQVVRVARNDDSSERRFAEAVQRAALADREVRRQLGERFAAIGVSRLVDQRGDGAPTSLFVAYSYSARRAYEVRLEGDDANLRLTQIRAVEYQPPPSEEELARAVELARASLSDRLDDSYESTAILVSDVEPGDRHYGTRRLTVGFGPPDERQPRVAVLVDLGEDVVLAMTVRRMQDPGVDAQ